MAKTIKDEQLKLTVIINGDEAKNELFKLEGAQRSLRETNKSLLVEKKKLEQQGKRNSAEYKTLTKSIKSNGVELKQNEARMTELRNQIGITGLTFNQLRSRARELSFAINNMTPGSPKRKLLEAELRQISAQMNKVKVGAVSTGFSIGKMADGFNKYFGVIGALAASLAGVIMGFRQLIDLFNEYQQEVAGLSSLTGLVGDELEWLTEQSKHLSTATLEGGVIIKATAKDIVESYSLIGSKMPILLQNKEALNEMTKAAIVLSEAGRIDLVTAADAMAAAINQFGLDVGKSTEMINMFAAASQAGAGDIAFIGSALTNFGAAAKSTNVSIEDSVIAIELLAKGGLEASVAGTGMKTFLLASAKAADEFNVEVVGLRQALINMNKAQLSTVDLQNMFGSRGFMVAAVLKDNIKEYDSLQESIIGTNRAYEMAAVNTDTSAAKLEQARNKAALLRMELGEKLAPALTFSTNSFSYLIKGIMKSIKFYQEHHKEIKTVLYALAAYIIVVNASVIADKLKVFWTNKVIASIKGLTAAMKANPWGLAAAAIAGLITWLVLYKKELDQITETQRAMDRVNKEVNQQYDEQAAKVSNLTWQIENGNLPLEKRRKAIEDMKAIMPEYNAYLTEEGELHDHNASALDNYLDNLRKKIIMNVMEQELTDLLIKQIDATRELEKAQDDQTKAQERYNTAFDQASSGKMDGRSMQGFAHGLNSSNKSLDKAKLNLDEVKDAITSLNTEYEKLFLDMDNASSTNDVTFIDDTLPNKDEIEEKKDLLGDYFDTLNKLLDDQWLKNLSRNERELIAIDRKYDEMYLKAVEAFEDEDALKQELQMLDDLRTAELMEKEKEIEERHQQELLRIKQRFGIDVSQELMDAELAVLQLHYENKLLSEEQFQQAKANIEAKYNKETETEEKKSIDRVKKWEDADAAEKIARIQTLLNTAQGLFKENTIAHKLFATASATMDTYQAATLALKSYPPPFSYIAMAATIGAGLQQVAKINAVQFASGKYDVIGADDGRTYRAGAVRQAATGIYPEPTLVGGLGLVGEKAPELVVDGPTLKNIQMNAPEIIAAIQAMRVPQYATGNYPAASASANGSGANTNEMADLIRELIEVSKRPTRAKIVYSDLEDVQDEMDVIKDEFSK